KETLERKYPGGLEAYEGNCPNKSFCADDYLTRVGFMHPTDVAEFIDRLVSLGFVFHEVRSLPMWLSLTKELDLLRRVIGLRWGGLPIVSQDVGSPGLRINRQLSRKAGLVNRYSDKSKPCNT